jgi:hypothetical protein
MSLSFKDISGVIHAFNLVDYPIAFIGISKNQY